jgi:hypothetical protein
MSNATRRMGLAVAVLGLAVVVLGQSAQAGILITINQVGPDVVATGSGSIDLTGLTFLTTESAGHSGTAPNVADILLGPPNVTMIDDYTGVTGPGSFGPGGGTNSSSGSGDLFGVAGAFNIIAVPHNYVSLTALSATDTFSGKTFSSLGLNPGTYTYTWGTGGPTHTLTVQVGVPEPATLVGAATGLVVAAAIAWRRHQDRSRCEI